MATTRIIWNQTTTSGRRTSWAKPFNSIKQGAKGAQAFYYAAADPLMVFGGDYLQDGVETDLPIGTLVIEVVPVGSVKNGSQQAQIFRVGPAGLGAVSDVVHDWHRGFLSLRDEALQLLGDEPEPENPLADFSDEQLLDELRRRGVVGEW
jgi:hypothetical protein